MSFKLSGTISDIPILNEGITNSSNIFSKSHKFPNQSLVFRPTTSMSWCRCLYPSISFYSSCSRSFTVARCPLPVTRNPKAITRYPLPVTGKAFAVTMATISAASLSSSIRIIFNFRHSFQHFQHLFTNQVTFLPLPFTETGISVLSSQLCCSVFPGSSLKLRGNKFIFSPLCTSIIQRKNGRYWSADDCLTRLRSKLVASRNLLKRSSP